jgi:hypothetical protein
LVATPFRKTYDETLKYHFEILEQVTGRLAFHGAKSNVMKCESAKGKLPFLGWNINHGNKVSDPGKIEKAKGFPFP